MRLRLLSLLLVTFLAGTAGCGGSDDGIVGPGTVAGTYSLRSINGQALPTNVGSATAKSGSFTLTANNTYTGQLTFRQAGASSDDTDTFSGTYALAGSTATFTEPGEAPYTGTFAGKVLTITPSDGGTFRFEK